MLTSFYDLKINIERLPQILNKIDKQAYKQASEKKTTKIKR